MTQKIIFNAKELPFRVREALRYAGAPTADEFIGHINICKDELLSVATPAVCYRILPILHGDGTVSMGGAVLTSRNLAGNLQNCDSVIVMAATLGVGVDRAILAASRTSPSKAVLLQGAAAELIESLCDEAERRILAGRGAKPRFSPGYGDLSLEAQKMIFDVLSPERHIGLTLNSSLMLSPAKSVTALVGIVKNGG